MFFEHTAYEGHNRQVRHTFLFVYVAIVVTPRQTRMLLGEAWKTPASSYEVARLADAGIKRLEEVRAAASRCAAT